MSNAISVDRSNGNPLPALRKMKRVYERQNKNTSGGIKAGDRHVKRSEKNRKAKLAAIKREEKKKVNWAKGVASHTRRYRNLSIKQIMAKIYGADR